MEKKYFLIFFILHSLLNYAQSVPSMYSKVNPAVVVVYTESKTVLEEHTNTPKMLSSISPIGSGFMVSDNEIITAANLIHVSDKVKVKFIDGTMGDAEVIALSESADLAMIRLAVPRVNAVTVPLGNSHQLRHGTPIFVVVAPEHLDHSVSVGGVKRVVKTKKGIQGINYVIATAPIESEYTGAPMFNFKGEVMGVVSHLLDISSDTSPIPYIITSNTVKELLYQELLEWNGINTRLLTGAIANRYKLPQKAGLLVEHIETSSPLGKMGVQKQDIILSLANTKVEQEGTSLNKIKNLSLELDAKVAVEIMILREDKMVFLNRK